MIAGIDIGYSSVKAISGSRRVNFLSVIGTPDRPRFSVSRDSAIILTAPAHVQVGEGAVEQSRFLQRREDRGWVKGDEWYLLFLAALTELSAARGTEARLVTGLPVAFFDDRQAVRDRLLGEHRVQRSGRYAQTFRVVDVRVVPQPFGTLLSVVLDDRGRIRDRDLAAGAVGVVDIGGKTTNLLSVNRLTEIARETASVNVGAWDVVRALRDWLASRYPDLSLRDHQIAQAITARQVRYFGETIDLTAAVETAVDPLAQQVVSAATQLWNGGASLDAILVTGGGAYLLERYIAHHFRQARLAPDPVFANAAGFWRFAQRLAGGGANGG